MKTAGHLILLMASSICLDLSAGVSPVELAARALSPVSNAVVLLTTNAAIWQDDQRICIAERTQQYTVTTNGPRLQTLGSKVLGPQTNGYVVQAFMHHGRYLSPLHRAHQPNFSRNEYSKLWDFYAFWTLTNLPDVNGYVVVDCKYGRSADTQLVSQIFEVVRSNTMHTLRKNE